MNRPAKRTVFYVVLVLGTFTFLGGVFGAQVQATPPTGAEVDASLNLFSHVLATVEENYATPVDSEKSIYGAIDGMLRTLDPHSKFFDPMAFKELRDGQKGRYFGLGIVVASRFNKVRVASPPFPGSPAEKVGLKIFDTITHVNGSPTQGLGLDSVVSQLRGPKGTEVKIRISRPGVADPIEMAPLRDEIPRPTVSNAFLIRPGMGYVKLDSFAETSAKEVNDAIAKLVRQNTRSLDGLVLDLRANPGGLLQAAIAISETFLNNGDIILKTQGRTPGSKQDYKSKVTNTNNQYPLVVLINKSSASASEIVSGAIQDQDRGLVVGETSFGKGLVQSVFQLKEDTGLALTTQKWLTPSGRLIQRDYSQISQFDYYNHRVSPEEQKKQDLNRTLKLNRPVYGGGGIEPDEAVPNLLWDAQHQVAISKPTEFQELLARNYVYFTFAEGILTKTPSIVDASFDVSDALLNQFRRHVEQDRKILISDKDFVDNRDFLKRTLRYEFLYDHNEPNSVKVLLEADPQVLKAIELMPRAKELMAAPPSRRQIAQQ